jgi:two-component system, NtrC family, sensor histidine kinase HydH
VTQPDYIAWLACASQLLLASLALAQPRRRTASRLLALVSFSLFAWNFAALRFRSGGAPAWHTFDVAISPTTPALGLHLVLVLVGKARNTRWLIVLSYVAFGTLSVLTALASVSAPINRLIRVVWAPAYFALSLPVLVFIVATLLSFHRQAVDREERTRARLMLSAFGVGGGLLLTEVLNDYLTWLPGLGALGGLLATSILALAVIRYGLGGEDSSLAGLRYAVPLALGGIATFGSLESVLSTHQALRVAAGLLVTLVLLGAMREFALHTFQKRERLQRLAFLGRLSAQLAHDLRNPLAAIKGGIDYLQDEADAAERARFLSLMDEQVARMEAVLEGYGRIGRIEVELQRVSLNELVAQVVEPQALAWPGIALELCRASDLPPCDVDPKLLTLALENLIRNAMQACRPNGRVVVRTAVGSAPNVTLIQVEDDGVGIRASDKEQVFDEFFTTREDGSGLGLSFVRKVARAHGGDVVLESKVGVGTVVSLCLPTGVPSP